VDFNLAVVVNKTQLPKFVHEKTHAAVIALIWAASIALTAWLGYRYFAG
jgi:hypothetical protein